MIGKTSQMMSRKATQINAQDTHKCFPTQCVCVSEDVKTGESEDVHNQSCLCYSSHQGKKTPIKTPQQYIRLSCYFIHEWYHLHLQWRKKTGHCCIIRRELNPDEVHNKKKCGEKHKLFQTKLGKKPKTQQPITSERVAVCFYGLILVCGAKMERRHLSA